jgi:hypothetical protein
MAAAAVKKIYRLWSSTKVMSMSPFHPKLERNHDDEITILKLSIGPTS